MKKIYLSLFGIIVSASLFGQLQLKPAIGPTTLPGDNDAVCNIICSSSYNFNTGGLQVGDTIPQFQFYTLAGTPVDALTQLQTGKPLLLIAGSITCPVYRGKINAINNIISTYGTQINTFIVYVVEAHPNTPDVSPYSCNVWTHSQNQSEGVLYLQQTTYGQRKAAVTDMMNNVCSCTPAINAPVIIDGPCNDYWTTFGEAPNNAYLINPLNGTVYCKHGWFNQAPNNMAACIDSLLAILPVTEQEDSKLTTVYPNPFAESATIKITGSELAGLDCTILDVCGKEVFPLVTKTADGLKVYKGELESGIYFYTLRKGNIQTASGKLIIQ